MGLRAEAVRVAASMCTTMSGLYQELVRDKVLKVVRLQDLDPGHGLAESPSVHTEAKAMNRKLTFKNRASKIQISLITSI